MKIILISLTCMITYKPHHVVPAKRPYTVSVDSARTADSTLNSFVDEWIGTRYIWGGMTKSGVDCSGFSTILYNNLYNIKLPRRAKEQYACITKISKNNLEAGDLVFFKNRGRWHVGIYLSNGYFIHASSRKTGVIISSLHTPHYIKAYLSGGRYE